MLIYPFLISTGVLFTLLYLVSAVMETNVNQSYYLDLLQTVGTEASIYILPNPFQEIP